MFNSGQPAFSVFAGHEPSLPVDRSTVGKPGRRHKDISTFTDFVIAHYTIIRYVAEQHESAGWVVRRPFKPATAGEQSGYGTVASRTSKARIQHLKLCRNELDHSSLLY